MSRPAPKDSAPNFKLTACVADHIGDRQDQQDRVAILTSRHYPGTLMAVVADGMGGRSGGRLASDQVMSTAKNLFDALPDHGTTTRDLLTQIATEAHAVIRLTALASEKEPTVRSSCWCCSGMRRCGCTPGTAACTIFAMVRWRTGPSTTPTGRA